MDKSRVAEVVGEPVSEFRVSAGCKDGDGMAGALSSIEVTTAKGEKINVVLKEIDKMDPMGSKMAVEQGTFVVESLVYTELIPKLKEFGTSHGMGDPVIPVPQIYSTYKGDVPLDHFICMKDIRVEGYKMTDKYSGLKLPETLLVAKEIGKFHAMSHALIKWEGEQIFAEKFKPFVRFFNIKDVSKDPKVMEFSALFNGSVENAKEILKSRNPELHQRMSSFFGKSETKLNEPSVNLRISMGTDLEYFPTIIHGDLWSNNIMFKYADDGTPISLKFYDFQFSRRGNIFEDLMYFMFTSTTPHFRSQHLLSVLREYFKSFRGTLEELGMDPPIGFTLGFLIDSFNSNMKYIYRHMCFAIPLQLGISISEAMKVMMSRGSGDGASSAPQKPPLPVSPEEGLKIFMNIMKVQMEMEPRAVDRLEVLTQEMIDLHIM